MKFITLNILFIAYINEVILFLLRRFHVNKNYDFIFFFFYKSISILCTILCVFRNDKKINMFKAPYKNDSNIIVYLLKKKKTYAYF